MEGEEILLYLCGCRRAGGHSLATGSRWILQRRASTSLLAPGGFLRNLRFRGVGEFVLAFMDELFPVRQYI